MNLIVSQWILMVFDQCKPSHRVSGQLPLFTPSCDNVVTKLSVASCDAWLCRVVCWLAPAITATAVIGGVPVRH